MAQRLTPAEARALMAHHQAQQPESVIVHQVRDYLRATGWFVIRVQQGPLCHKGISDLICIKEGRVEWLECKTAKGKLSAHQEQFRADIEAAGGCYRVVRGIEDLEG